MKTTVQIAEEESRAALARREQKTSYQWPDLSVAGEGLAPEIEEGTWEPLRDRIYTGELVPPKSHDQ